MRSAGILLFMIGAVCLAQRETSDETPSPAKQLQSVTWDLKNHKLVWVVQNGTVVHGQFEGGASDQYEITPREGVMTFAGERRGFSPQEAVAVQKLLDTLSLYCAESVIWWDHGEGVKLDENGEPDGDSIQQPAPSRKAPKASDIAMIR